MATNKVLIPYNFTVNDRKSLAFAIDTFAHKETVKITLLNIYIPLPAIDMSASPELTKMKNGLAFLSQELKKKENGLKTAQAYLIENGFSEDQVDYVLKKKEVSIADDIVNMVLEEYYNVLVLSRQPAKVTRLFTRNVHDRALAILEAVTVCIAI